MTWRCGALEVTATNNRGVYCVRLDPYLGGMQDAERPDVFTATTLAKSIAGYFDAWRLTEPVDLADFPNSTGQL